MTTVQFGDTRLPLRFWSKAVVLPTGCWEWRATLSGHGYGSYFFNGRMRPAHRAVYEALVGPILAETIDHLCRVRNCVNPAHLEPVSSRENSLRGDTIQARNLRKTHCPRGHEYAGQNLIERYGMRYCRTCHDINNRRSYERTGRQTRRTRTSKVGG